MCDSVLLGPAQDALCLRLRLLLDGFSVRQLAGSQTAASPNACVAGILIPHAAAAAAAAAPTISEGHAGMMFCAH